MSMLTLFVDDHLYLKQLETPDALTIFETINSQRDYLRQWLPFVDHTQEIGDTIQFIKTVNQDKERVFVLKYEEQFAGLIGFRDTDKSNKKSEIGYWLSEPFQKKGIVTNAVKVLVKYAFDELNMNRIEIKCAVGNAPSKRIPQRLGFSFEGIIRQGELFPDGRFVDLECYSLLRHDMVSWLENATI